MDVERFCSYVIESARLFLTSWALVLVAASAIVFSKPGGRLQRWIGK